MYPEYNQEYVPTYIMDFPEIREYVPCPNQDPAPHPFHLQPDPEGEGIVVIGPAISLLSREATFSLANELYTLATRL